MDKRILITGGTGLLGKALIETGQNRELFATYFGNYSMSGRVRTKYAKIDIRDSQGLKKIFDNFNPDVVIHTVSVGSPDFAEKNKKYAWEVDVLGTRIIVDNCKRSGARLIYISSNGIYDGKKAPYCESDKARPVNYYGKIKLEAEETVKAANCPYAIVRPILMYGWNYCFERPNIITIALERLKKGQTLNAYDDVFCNPVWAEFCARAIWRIVGQEKYDIFNISGSQRVSVYEFVKEASRVFELDEGLVIPVQQGFFNELVKRPRDTSYNHQKMMDILGLSPLTVRDGLILMKESGQKRDE